MSNTTTIMRHGLQVCTVDTISRCYSDFALKAIIISISIISVAINIFHLIVIGKLSSIRGSTYLIMLQQISAADIYSTLTILNFLCPIAELYNGMDLRLAAIMATLQGHCGLSRLSVLAVASYERYLTICCPIEDEKVCGMKRHSQVKVMLTCLWIVPFFVPFIKNFIFREHLCLWALFGPGILGAPHSGIIVTIYVLFLILFIISCSIRVLVSLRKLQQQTTSDDANYVARKAAHYIIIINVAHFICLIPAYSSLIIMSFGVSVISTRWVVHFAYSLYGIFNVVIYGWLMQPYRQFVKNVVLAQFNKSVGGLSEMVTFNKTAKKMPDDRLSIVAAEANVSDIAQDRDGISNLEGRVDVYVISHSSIGQTSIQTETPGIGVTRF